MTYYEILNVSDEATKIEIKKAYFSIVKQFPPEKFPEKFKEYRKAYDTLSDTTLKVEYDNRISLPEEFMTEYNLGIQSLKTGDYEKAIKKIKPIVANNPNLYVLNDLLGKLYIENENTGNAVKIYEHLVSEMPQNLDYHLSLGKAYQIRGFHRKAIDNFNFTIENGFDNVFCWTGLVKVYMNTKEYCLAEKYLLEAISIFEKSESNCTELYITAIDYYCQAKDLTALKLNINKLKKYIDNDPMIKEDISYKLIKIIGQEKDENSSIDTESVLILLKYLKEIFNEGEMIDNMHSYFSKKNINEKLGSDKNIKECILRTSLLSQISCNCENCIVQKALWESEFLDEINETRKSLRHLKQKYPELYDLNAVFNNKVLDIKNEQRLFQDVYKNIMKVKKQYPEAYMEANGSVDFGETESFETEDFIEPFVREAAKIGRNEFCPCGSGKKYKKCCGA